MGFVMAKWFTRHTAVRWAVLLLLVVTSSCQTIDEGLEVSTEESFVTDITTGYPETTTGYSVTTTGYPETTTGYPETTTGYSETTTEYPEIINPPISETALGDTKSSDAQRNERMVAVYVKPDPKAKTRNISDFLDYGDVIVETRDKGTIVVTNPDDEEDEEGEDGDVMRMAARSLRQNLTDDQLAAEAAAFQSAKLPLLKDNELKDVLHKWNREFNFNLTDLYKINLASVFAKEYDEMNKLMNENLVEDTDVFARSRGMAEGFEPRDFEKADLDMAVEATEVVSQRVVPPPSSTPPPVFTPRTGTRPNSQQRFTTYQYTYQGRIPPMLQPVIPGQQMFHRSDTGSPYRSLPRTASSSRKPEKSQPVVYQTVTGPPMIIHSDGSSVRSPTPLRQPPASVAPRIRRPTTTPPPSGRFGDRFGHRLPRPFQRILNMTVGGRQTTTEPPKAFYSSIAHLPASSVSHPARVRAPYYLQQSYQNSIPSNARTRPPVATTTRPRVTTESSRTEFGARIRPSRIERQRNSTNGMPNTKEETKEQRDMKISQLRSNLVGKLVVIQSMLDEKEKKSKAGNSRAPAVPLKRLPGGLLKPIVPLRPRVNVATTDAPVTTTDAAEEVVTTESTIAWKDKKKYRRPPSFRKGNTKISSGVPKAQGESVEVTTTAGVLNTTETPVNEVNSTRPADVGEVTSTATTSDAGETTTDATAPSVDKMSSAVNSTETTPGSSTTQVTNTPASDVTVVSVETSTNTAAAPAESLTETKLNDKETSTSAPGAMTSTVETTTTNTTATTARSSTETKVTTSTPASAPSAETTSEILRQSNLDISTEAKISGEDALSTPRPVAAPQTVPTPIEIGATEGLSSSRQETTTIPDLENSSTANAMETPAGAIHSTSGALKSTLEVSSVENATEYGNTSTYSPENDPYLKAMIARALQLSEQGKPQDIQGNISEEDDPLEDLEEVPRGFFRDLVRETEEDNLEEDDVAFPEGALEASLGGSTKEDLTKDEEIPSNAQHESDSQSDKETEDGSFDLPDDALDPVENKEEELSSNDSVLSRVDRSAEVNMLNRKPTAAIDFARGGVRPVNLPYNILPDNVDKLKEARPAEDGSEIQMQAREIEVALPLGSYPIFQVQRHPSPSFAGFMNRFYSRFRS